MLKLTIERKDRKWAEAFTAWVLRIALPHRWAKPPRVRFTYAEPRRGR